MFMPLMGYRLSVSSASSTTSLYHSMKSFDLGTCVAGMGEPATGGPDKRSGARRADASFGLATGPGRCDGVADARDRLPHARPVQSHSGRWVRGPGPATIRGGRAPEGLGPVAWRT